jgi:hypothetical protein
MKKVWKWLTPRYSRWVPIEIIESNVKIHYLIMVRTNTRSGLYQFKLVQILDGTLYNGKDCLDFSKILEAVKISEKSVL